MINRLSHLAVPLIAIILGLGRGCGHHARQRLQCRKRVFGSLERHFR